MLTLQYIVQTQLELNLSYMPFIKNGGLFIPTNDQYALGNRIEVELQLPGFTEVHRVEGKVIWITPKNALYQIYPGIGIQLVGDNANPVHELIKEQIDNTMEVGGYTYGMSGELA
jgi:type IV pilus assembly protein PilZ